jgi:hypothetical protein
MKDFEIIKIARLYIIQTTRLPGGLRPKFLPPRCSPYNKATGLSYGRIILPPSKLEKVTFLGSCRKLFFSVKKSFNFFLFVIDPEVDRHTYPSATAKFDFGWGIPCTLSLRGSVN